MKNLPPAGGVGWLTRPGKKRRFRAWIFTAVRSRHRFVYPTFEETTARAIEACEAAWGFFGGIFKVLIPDNTKAIVITADRLAPRITPAFLEYAQARHFHIDPARMRHARAKQYEEGKHRRYSLMCNAPSVSGSSSMGRYGSDCLPSCLAIEDNRLRLVRKELEERSS